MIDGMDIRRRLQKGERFGWRLAARLVFVAIVLSLALMAVAANSILIALFAAVMLGTLLRSILPQQRIQSWARGYATGEAGDRWRRRWDRLKAGVRRMIPYL